MRKLCPCASGKAFTDCCQPIIEHDCAQSPEQLMRSRYTAFALGHTDYIIKTWHPSTCPKDFQLGKSQWLGLQIHQADKHRVSFSAAFQSNGKHLILKETSRFLCIDGHWRYMDGDCTVAAVKRNDLCFCGSHKKYKTCCAKKLRPA